MTASTPENSDKRFFQSLWGSLRCIDSIFSGMHRRTLTSGWCTDSYSMLIGRLLPQASCVDMVVARRALLAKLNSPFFQECGWLQQILSKLVQGPRIKGVQGLLARLPIGFRGLGFQCLLSSALCSPGSFSSYFSKHPERGSCRIITVPHIPEGSMYPIIRYLGFG